MSTEVDPDMAPILQAMRAAPPADYEAMSTIAARAIFDQGARVWSSQAPPCAHVEDLAVKGPTGPMRARLYRPSEGVLPLIVYVHGGGWTFGSVLSHESEMAHLARASGAAVLGLDYRLAPEHPFPAGLDDVLAAISACRDGAIGARIDADRIALAGDSAGATLALGALIAMRDTGAPPLRGAVLYYGCYAPRYDTESHRLFGNGQFGLSSDRMRWYWRNFLGDVRKETPALAAPLGADLGQLPPLYLVAAGLDPLRDDTRDLAAALTTAGVEHEFAVVPGVIHGFLRMAAQLPAARHSAEAAGAFLKSRLT